jgi:hypothetical protein
MKSRTIYLNPDGTAEHLGTEDFGLDGQRTVTRFSEIVPALPLPRLAFRFLRGCFGDTGHVAAWTREWRGLWTARILKTGATFTHPDRQACLMWEAEQFNNQ